MANQLLTDLGVLVSYWKLYKSMGISKDLVRGTLEHGYKVLDTYRYMIESINPGRAVYNIMTSNIVESVNSLFGDEREFSIMAMFEKISEKYSDFFKERRVQFKCPEKRTRFVLKIKKKISMNISLEKRLFSHKIANYKFRITGHGDAATVYLQTRSCTWRVFDLDKIPCPHAMATLQAQYGNKYGPEVYDHSSQYYSVEKYEMIYIRHITPVPSEESWVVLVELMGRLIPSPYIHPSTIKSGRNPYKRRNGVGESFLSRRNKCSICKCVGHKRTTWQIIIHHDRCNCSNLCCCVFVCCGLLYI
ncbi:hypothetical protein P3S67_013477 [Capsicum chacoense]